MKAPVRSAPSLAKREQAPPNTNAAIVTENGPLKGIEAFGVNAWLGIPYAVAAVGNLRWMPPQRHEKLHGVSQANTSGSACTQPDAALGTIIGQRGLPHTECLHSCAE